MTLNRGLLVACCGCLGCCIQKTAAVAVSCDSLLGVDAIDSHLVDLDSVSPSLASGRISGQNHSVMGRVFMAREANVCVALPPGFSCDHPSYPSIQFAITGHVVQDDTAKKNTVLCLFTIVPIAILRHFNKYVPTLECQFSKLLQLSCAAS